MTRPSSVPEADDDPDTGDVPVAGDDPDPLDGVTSSTGLRAARSDGRTASTSSPDSSTVRTGPVMGCAGGGVRTESYACSLE